MAPSVSTPKQLARLLDATKHHHINIRNVTVTGGEWLEGWVWRYDPEVEKGEGAVPGLKILHTDGYVRWYWSIDTDVSYPPVFRDRNSPDQKLENFATEFNFVGDATSGLTEQEVDQKVRNLLNLGGDAVGKKLLAAGENLVGRRVNVWWPGDNQNFAGVIFAQDNKLAKPISVGFDDGEEDSYDLREEQWNLEETLVVIQHEKYAFSVNYDINSGRAGSVQCFVNTSAPSLKRDQMELHVGEHCICAKITPKPAGRSGRKKNYVFIYPGNLNRDEAEAVCDSKGYLRITVPLAKPE